MTRMTRKIQPAFVLLIALVVLVSGTGVLAVPAATGGTKVDAAITRYRTNQQRARELTRDLLALLLETHIQQLEDNNLTDMPLYKDLIDMRGRMNELAMRMMPQVIKSFDKSSAATTAQGRTDALKEAQKKMHVVLMRLLAERERLRIRRQQAELIERI